MTPSPTGLDPEFLQLLACPLTHESLRELGAAELDELNARIARGGLRNRGGAAVTAPLGAALRPEQAALVYPVVDGIPMLLATEAIPLDQTEGTSAATEATP